MPSPQPQPLRASIKAWLLGSSTARGPQAPVVAGMLQRPEGLRHYRLAVPSQPAQGLRPLVILLHGAGASAKQVLGGAFPPSPLSVWLEIAEREQWLVVAGDAGRAGWSDCFASARRVAAQDDVAFVAALIDKAIVEWGADPARVFVMGVSRGGFLAYRVACELGHRLAGFSAVLASMPAPKLRLMAPQAAVSALIFGAVSDPLVRFAGGKFFYTLGFMRPTASIPASAQIWRQHNQLPAEPVVSEVPHRHAGDPTRTVFSLWGESPQGLQVGLVTMRGAGHAEPSALKRYPRWINLLTGAQSADLEVAEVAWAFFKDKRMGLPTKA